MIFYLRKILLKQLNPYNTQINESNRHQFVQIDEIRAFVDLETSKLYSKIVNTSASRVKKFYLAMEFNQINNPEFQDERLYSLGMFSHFNRTPLYTPQINNISMIMPSLPVLYEWHKVPKVYLTPPFYRFYVWFIVNLFLKKMICNHINRSHICPDLAKYCACFYTLEFNIGEVVEFVIADEGFTFQSNHPSKFFVSFFGFG